MRSGAGARVRGGLAAAVFVAASLARAQQPDTEPAPASEAAAESLDGVEFADRIYFREETLRGFLRHPVPGPLDEEVLESDRELIEARYKDRGYLAAKVSLELVAGASPGGRIARFVIAAGERAKLLTVDVVGNERVTDDELREGFFSRPPELLGALTRAGFFHKPYLDQDSQRLLANYYKRGFLEARVVNTRVVADPDLGGLHVTFDVHEGFVYELAGLSFAGDLPEGVTSASLREQIPLKDGEVADLVTLQQQADGLLDPLREQGYPYARFEQGVQVAPPPSGREDRRAVALTLKMVAGPAAVVRKVRIVGDPGTMDHVILREVTVEEGKPYRHSDLKTTQQKLMALGFFQQVLLRPVPAPAAGEVDVEIQLVEQPTWILSPTAFVASEGIVGVLVAGDRNLLGTGLYASFIGQLSLYRQLFDLTLTEPRLFGGDVALTLEAHRRELGYSGFRLRSDFGGGVRASLPLGLGFHLGLGVTSEFGGVAPYDELPLAKSDLLPQNVFRNVVDVSLAWDRRDSLLSPRNGVFAQVRADYTGPFTLSGTAALDASANLRLFWTPLWGITLKSNTDVGYVMNPHGGEVAVTERSFLGGFGSVRGYFPRSISPKRLVPVVGGDPVEVEVGGLFRVVQNLELEFPLWPETPFRGFFFVDAGNAFDDDEPWFSSELDRETLTGLPLGVFWSTGFGVLVETPVLPLRLEVSVPLTRRAYDREWDFFVGIGSAF